MKPRTDLLPADALLVVGRVFAHGAEKHGERGWERRPILPEYGAALRHLFRWAAGEANDPESGEPHLAHAAARVLIALSLHLREVPPASAGTVTLVEMPRTYRWWETILGGWRR